MKSPFHSSTKFVVLVLAGSAAFLPSLLLNTADAAKTRRTTKTKATAKTNVPAFFYDETWSYRTGTLYDEKKNIVVGVRGEAKFNRNGKFEQNYYIGGIGNFYKGTYKINGDRLTTFDEKGKKIFDYKFTVGATPKKILVLSMLEKDGSKSMDFSLVPLEKKKPQ